MSDFLVGSSAYLQLVFNLRLMIARWAFWQKDVNEQALCRSSSVGASGLCHQCQNSRSARGQRHRGRVFGARFEMG
ncbi:hypothetical protein EMIT0P291_70148 [Pseudomonas sp. IT-P291]